VAILAAAPIEQWIRGTLEPGRARWLGRLVGAGGAAMASAGLYLAYRGVEDYPVLVTPGRVVAALLTVGGLAVLAGAGSLARRRPLAAPAAFAATLVALYLLAAIWVLPAANAHKSARPFCEELARIVPRERPLRSYRSWHWRASYVYYADRTIDPIESPRELERYWAEPGAVFLLVERDRLDEVLAIVGRAEPRLAREIGGNAVYLFTNR
jgi:hypothetical protein